MNLSVEQILLIVNIVGLILVLRHSVVTRQATRHISHGNTALNVAVSILKKQLDENTVLISGLVHNIEILHIRLLDLEGDDEDKLAEGDAC
jgi:hypothetical protein